MGVLYIAACMHVGAMGFYAWSVIEWFWFEVGVAGSRVVSFISAFSPPLFSFYVAAVGMAVDYVCLCRYPCRVLLLLLLLDLLA